ncbi:MAG: MarR family transcriptional regulator [Lentimicrobium sp.]|jgi:DNA-binding MarR family transcriptional regulator|nr:MarR family transcriptional regulator [Lentimicrobium sp.]MDD2528518.1 MarR family transcriptional regulator [Lentimicrobiaceae bacterium]MDD4597521.1 MarR family transcriptional regulator [Lentimicrobiaceae bacterium]MDY0027177.1 MarR family transcriptional regulator [Lentimicrobium sp.]HAH58917.1 MarR family transcriptional regulator [Bacteroidales bacterium]
MKEKTSPYCHCLYYSANALSRLITKISDEEFAATGLTSSSAFIMMTVNNHPGISPKEISEIMLLTPSTVTRLLDKLAHSGLLTREQKGKNIFISPTPSGRELHQKIKDSWKRLYERYTSVIGEDQARKLTALLTEAYAKLS